MQRINLYPNPRFDRNGASTGAWGTDYANDMPGDGTLRPSHSQEFDELRIPELNLGVEYVFSVRSDNRLGGAMVVIANTYSSKISPDGNGLIVVRLTAPATGSQGENRVVFYSKGVYSQPQLELASTYDAALGGGVSSLLLRRHDATRLTPRTGTVMPDDNHEHLPGNKGENTGRTALVSEVRGWTQRQLLHSLHCGKCWANAINWQARNLQLVHFAGNCRERTCARCRHLACQLWRFGHHCDRHHDLRELQCHEKDIRRAGNNRIQRGYHAARLTLMGVVA